ncbi:MAG: hypothetical protein MR598_03520 [Erysipelotrichaceae bacterium]|nr:hypothetical protein [Erysipelotrichaceae bacterium]
MNYRWMNLILIFVMMFLTLSLILFEYNSNRLFTYIMMFPLLIVPFVASGTKYQLGVQDLFWYYLFIFFAYFLGGVMDFYNQISWYDLLVHFMSGIFSFSIGQFILKKWSSECLSFWNKMIFGLFVVMFVAGIWELFEYSVDFLFGFDFQHQMDTGVVDTMEDILVAFLAGILSVIGHSIYCKIN